MTASDSSKPRSRWSFVSRQIITGVAVELILVTLLMTWGFGFGFVGGFLFAVLVIVLIRVVLALLSFALAWYFRSEDPCQRRLGLSGITALIAREITAFLKLFFVYHSFEPLLNAHDPAPVAGDRRGPPVLFVHGFFANAGFWYTFKRYFEREGFGAVYSLNLDPPFADIDTLADSLALRVKQVCAHSQQPKLVLIAHSMGGLVCRSFLSRYGEQDVSHLITLGSPHYGTYHAYLLPGANLRQMRPRNDWLNELNAARAGLPVTSVYSVHDNIIAPQDSSRLPGANEIVVTGIGHLSMAFSATFMRTVLDIFRTNVQNA